MHPNSPRLKRNTAKKNQSHAVLAMSIIGLLYSAATFAKAEAVEADVSKPSASMQMVLDKLASLNGRPIELLSAQDARLQPTPADAVAAIMKEKGMKGAAPMLEDVDDRSIDGPAGSIPIRVYTPAKSGAKSGAGTGAGSGPFPVLVYFHGGGFVIATNDTYDASARALAKQANCVVVAVEYRKAPENKYPAAVDDAFAAYQWVVNNAGEIQGDASRIAVAGESAGGNLATVTAMKAKQNNVQLPVFQLLIYPLVSDDQTTESYKKYEKAKPLNKAMISWFSNHYLPNPATAADPLVSPLKATKGQLAGLPPAFVITAEIDPLRSEGEAYAKALKAAGVAVEYKNYPNVTHEFFGMAPVVETAVQAQADAAAALKAAFARVSAK